MKTDSKVDYASEEFWKDAPEGATHYILGKGGFCSSDFVIDTGNQYAGTTPGISYWVKEGLTECDYFEVFERPQPKPVYTQEMHDKGELPPVGSEFMHKGQVATVLSTSSERDGVVTFTVDDGCSIECCWNNDAWVNPVDTRTDEEKAFDSFLDSNYNMKRSDFSQSQDDKDFIEGVYLAFKAGVTWSKGNE